MSVSPASVAARPRSLDSVARKIHTVSSLPHVALKVMEVAQDPRSGAQELKQAMESDPSLCARVLKCVNSSAYALRAPISSLQHAIAYLGVKQIRNLAMSAAVSELFKGDGTVGSYSRAGLWKHLVAVGICAKMIAMRCRLHNFEDMFLAGLLHDIGIVLEDEHVHPPFCTIMESFRDDTPLGAVEREVLGFDHMTLAERVTREWRFPETVVAAVRHHHDSSRCPEESLQIVRCVEAANILCSLKGMTSVGKNLVAFSAEVFAALSLGKDDIIVLAGDLDRELEASRSIFTV
jgi:putative nucleotidyltransferase with HDIG domain